MTNPPCVPAKRTRQGKPKVRSGCITCKLRRVKCDETKPSCIRCVNYLGRCEGYQDDRRRSLARRSRAILILPKIVGAQVALTADQPYVGPKFENDHEARYFQLFLSETSPYLGGAFEISLWDRSIAQVCVEEPFALHAVVAVGALSKMIIDGHQQPDHEIEGKAVPCKEMGHRPKNEHYAYALWQYDRALKEMRQTLGSGEKYLRRALLGCLLIVCFEGLHGNQGSASAHAQSGLVLLYQWLLKNRRPQTSGLSSPFPDIVDEGLIQAFSRLDLQVLTFLDSRPLALHLALKDEGEEMIENMPSTFSDLHEARITWELIMRRTGHFMIALLSEAKSRNNPSREMTPLEDLCEVPPAINTLNLPMSGSSDPTPEHDLHAAEIDRWSRAFDPLFTKLTILKHRDLLGATMLKIHVKMSQILLRATTFRSEGAYDLLNPSFHELYNLAASIYDRLAFSSTRRSLYHFDLGVIPPLFLLATRCRDRALRRQAVRLLASSHHREGVWDSIGAATIAGWLAETEDEGLPTVSQMPDVPEHRRARITKLNMNLQQRRAQIQWTRRRGPGPLPLLVKGKGKDEGRRGSVEAGVEWHETELEWGCCTEFCRCAVSLRAGEFLRGGKEKLHLDGIEEDVLSNFGIGLNETKIK